jgi:hypothetical protein
MTMSLDTMAMLRSNCGSALAIHAFIASTSLGASSVPPGVRTSVGWPALNSIIGLRS